MEAMLETLPKLKPDGRHARAARTRNALLAACREMMREGSYQPDMKAIARRSGYSVRSCFQHFGAVDKLWQEALHLPEIFDAVAGHAVGSIAAELPDFVVKRIVAAVVFHERHAGS